MGFGSYDESEQENQAVETEDDDGEGVSVHENDHQGDVSFETDESATDLVERLQDIKADADED
jgi:hypothetical protein